MRGRAIILIWALISSAMSTSSSFAQESDGDLDKYCLSLMAPATNMSFKSFDPRFHDSSWEAARASVLARCKEWSDGKQDAGRISNLNRARQAFVQETMQLQDKLVQASIQRLGPVRNQQDSHLCWANSVADIATHASGTRVSAISVMVRTFRRDLDKFGTTPDFRTAVDRYTSGGYIDLALNGLGDGPHCVDDQKRETLTYKFEDLRGLWRDYYLLRRSESSSGPTESTNTKDFRKRNHSPQQSNSLTMPQLNLGRYLQHIAPSLNAQNFFQDFNSSQDLDIGLANWLNRQCKIQVPRGRIVHAVKPVTAALDSALEAGALPVLTYNSNFLVQGSGLHASTIVARASIQGQTYYLIRNTWGASCAGYNPEVTKKCKLGHFWITQEEAERTGSEVDYIEYFKR